MLTIRPKPRDAMPSTVALISMIGATRFGTRPASHCCFVEIAEIAGRRTAGVGDQDVRLGAGLQQGFAALFLGDVADHGRDLAFGDFADRGRRRHHLGFVAAVDDDIDAFTRQRFRATSAETLA